MLLAVRFKVQFSIIVNVDRESETLLTSIPACVEFWPDFNLLCDKRARSKNIMITIDLTVRSWDRIISPRLLTDDRNNNEANKLQLYIYHLNSVHSHSSELMTWRLCLCAKKKNNLFSSIHRGVWFRDNWMICCGRGRLDISKKTRFITSYQTKFKKQIEIEIKIGNFVNRNQKGSVKSHHSF